jgi:glycerol-3-phosphate dehydrogenase
MRAAALAAGAAFFYQRWRVRSFGLQPAATYRHADSPVSSTPITTEAQGSAPTTRAHRWTQLQLSSPDTPFDVLVIGGGLTGLYTAVDAAQRGLRVALVDASDIGGGSTTACMPAVSPGPFPYVQRAIRQRDVGWLRVAMTVLEEEAAWQGVAAACVVAPETVPQRLRRGWRQLTSSLRGSETAEELGGLTEPHTKDSAPRPATTLLPALHSSEMVEYVCAAAVSTVLSVLCGPWQPISLLSAAAVEWRLPALAATSSSTSSSSSSSSSPTVRVKGGVVTNNVRLESHAAAVALATTAEELGVVLCTYAPVVRIQEAPHEQVTSASPLSRDHPTQEQGTASSTWWRRLGYFSAPPASSSAPSSLMVAHVCDALATTDTTAVHDADPRHPSLASSATTLLSRWLPSRGVTSVPSDITTTPSEGLRGALKTSRAAATASSSSSAAVVYARSIVNCAGCGVDEVKALFDSNALDTVPAAFEGYLAYSYLVAPASAVAAADVPMPTPTNTSKGAATTESYPTRQETHHSGSPPPPLSLATSTRTTGLHFSSPRLSFASAMVLPWWDRCVLLGPSVSPLPHVSHHHPPDQEREASLTSLPTVAADGRTQRTSSKGVLDGTWLIQSKDGYAVQRERILSMLASCGVAVDASRLLSCVSQVVPCMRDPEKVPFQRELLEKGYAVHFSSVPLHEDDDGSTQAVATRLSSQARVAVDVEDTVDKTHEAATPRRAVAFLHVYGGTPVLARRVAEDAINALVQNHPTIFGAERVSKLHACRTRRLRLTMPPSLVQTPSVSSATTTTSQSGVNAVSRLQTLVTETYAERLVDVVARRTHVAYTSPDDALVALPSIASVMRGVKGWSVDRAATEVAAARHYVASVAVATPAAAA